MSTTIKLLSERVRPKKLEHLILLDRIAKQIGDGNITQPTLLEGTAGVGKTTLAKIIAKDKDLLYINTSLDRGVDVLRRDILEFCNTRSWGDHNDDEKVVIFDEIDGATDLFFKALRGIMNDNPHVLFLATCNDITRISSLSKGAIESRFNVISFNPKNKEEEKELKIKYMKRIKGMSAKLGIEWESTKTLQLFVETYFPDMRKIVSKIQDYHFSKIEKVTTDDIKSFHYTFQDIYKLCFSKPDPINNYKYIMSNYMNKPDELLQTLGVEFIEWIKENKPNDMYKIGRILDIVTDYKHRKAFLKDKILAPLAAVLNIQTYVNS